MKFECPVVQITKIDPVPKSDALDITTVFETPCIVRRGQLKVGDLAVYIPVESMVPMTKPQFQGLGIKTERELYRVKAVRLRGTYSEGLLVPFDGTRYAHEVGDCMASEWGITKYEEPELPISVNGKVTQQARDLPWAPKYNVESILKNRDSIPEGEGVQVTEKIHGCVPPHAQIIMADGSFRRMDDVKEGDFVLGKTPEGATVAAKVLEKFDNGETDRWLHFRTTNNEAGRGGPWRAFTCTPNHEVFVNGAFVAAETIKVGDRVLVNRRDMELNPIQREVLTGKLLGDGSMFSAGKSVVWGHSEAQRDYSNWTAECIGMLAHPTEAFATSGYGSEMSRRRTVNSDLVKELTSRFDTKDGKQVPSDLVLTPISLAFWYMDDGSLSHGEGQIDRASFAACSFSQTSVINLVAAMNKIGLNPAIQGQPGRFRLNLNTNDAELFFLMIAPYVHPSLQYKLPARYRGAPAWFPKAEYKPTLVPQTVTRIQKKVHKTKRLDMHTETSNYFVGGVLVHNCNGRFVWDGKELHVGSHNVWKKPMHLAKNPSSRLSRWWLAFQLFVNKLFANTFKLELSNDDVWWNTAKTLGLKEKLAEFFPMYVFYGEVYGKVQDLKYGVDGTAFRVFDIYNATNKEWEKPDTVVAICARLGIEHVPVLYHGPYFKDVVDPLRTGKSVLHEGTIREGIVIKLLDNKGRNSAMKYVSEQYKLRKDGSEFK